MSTAKADPKRIKASPTKEFFIHMLTRDVQLVKSILDLVDNCVDGARRHSDNYDHQGLWISITVSFRQACKTRFSSLAKGTELLVMARSPF